MPRTRRPRPPRRHLGGPFGNVVTANISSSLGDGIARVAAPLLAVRLTDDPLLISGIAAVAMLPWLFFAIPAGIVLDRIDRRRALALANGVRTVLAVLLLTLAATDTLTIWWLYVVIFAYGAFETLYDGAIRAVVPALVERRDLPRANSRIEAGEITVQNFLSAPLTSALFAIAVVIPLGVGALAYAVAGVLAFFLPVAAAGTHRATSTEPVVAWYRQLADGFRFILAHPLLKPLWILSVLIGICFSAATATVVLFVLERLGVPEAWFGAFMLVGAVGSLVGAGLAGRAKERFGAGRVMASANLVGPLSLVLMGAVPLVPVVAVCLAVSFGSTTVWNVLVMSLRQSLIPAGMLGRVHGTWRTLLWGTMPLGALLGGLLARVDLTTPLVVAGGLAALVALLGFRFIARLPNPEDVHDQPPVGDRQT
ncbi:MFS transporter [Oerskovia flava]|uniref:MFS transporter n=1 Tax=Oerskovia flava TaxID=2986422 RepID=UPI00223ECFB7|nr:MFS transporter [Oerskovia sp. JB1-3-2]